MKNNERYSLINEANNSELGSIKVVPGYSLLCQEDVAKRKVIEVNFNKMVFDPNSSKFYLIVNGLFQECIKNNNFKSWIKKHITFGWSKGRRSA